jgi:hypothetical protein
LATFHPRRAKANSFDHPDRQVVGYQTDILERWRDDISALAALPNVAAKHSGLGMPVLGLGPLPREQFSDAIAPLVTHLDQAFGPERTFLVVELSDGQAEYRTAGNRLGAAPHSR